MRGLSGLKTARESRERRAPARQKPMVDKCSPSIEQPHPALPRLGEGFMSYPFSRGRVYPEWQIDKPEDFR